MENHVWLWVESLPPQARRYEPAQIGKARIGSVHNVTFELCDTQRYAWREIAAEGKLKLSVDHPHYTEEAIITHEAAAALAEDFSEAPRSHRLLPSR